jgi:cyclopropane fatty-acyl-phospholipid synthase-like methyltransferase
MADKKTEIVMANEAPENTNPVSSEASKISDFEKQDLQHKVEALNASENIPEGSKVFDVGCGGGALGVLAADSRKGDLVQADWFDARRYKVGELKTFPRSGPGAAVPDFTGINADRALLVDVIHHVGYGNGWDQETNTPNMAGRVEDCIKFINGVATGLNENGKVLILNTRPEGEEINRYLKVRINSDAQLKDKVKML